MIKKRLIWYPSDISWKLYFTFIKGFLMYTHMRRPSGWEPPCWPKNEKNIWEKKNVETLLTKICWKLSEKMEFHWLSQEKKKTRLVTTLVLFQSHQKLKTVLEDGLSFFVQLEEHPSSHQPCFFFFFNQWNSIF